jgi:magnesium-transporting ATPase (P-type)
MNNSKTENRITRSWDTVLRFLLSVFALVVGIAFLSRSLMDHANLAGLVASFVLVLLGAVPIYLMIVE